MGEREVKVWVQERDRRLLKLCYEHRFITLEHAEYEFRDASTRAARQRMLELERAGFFLRKPSPNPERRHFYRLTKMGRDWAINHAHPDVSYNKSVNLNQFDHDSIVASVRQRLAQVWDAEFIPDTAITPTFLCKRIPDGFFEFPKGKRIALEVEHTNKGAARFEALASRWRYQEKVIFVLYVATKPQLFRQIQKHIPKVPDQPMGVVAWDDLKNGYPSIWTVRGEMKLFERRTF